MADRVWLLPKVLFITAWNGTNSLSELMERMKALTGGPVSKLELLARSQALKSDGIAMKNLKIEDQTESVIKTKS